MTQVRRPSGPYLMESAEGVAWVQRRRPARCVRIAMLPLSIPCAAIEGYFSEVAHILSAGPIELPA